MVLTAIHTHRARPRLAGKHSESRGVGTMTALSSLGKCDYKQNFALCNSTNYTQ